jgi:hypothetical protein
MSRAEQLYWAVEIPGGYELTGSLEHIDGRIELIRLEDGTQIEAGNDIGGCCRHAPDSHKHLMALIGRAIREFCSTELERAAADAHDRAHLPEYA